MRSFADLIETVTPAAGTAEARNLTSRNSVKTALRIIDTASDDLIDALLPRVSALIVAHCRLARDAAGSKPTFARETLRATWMPVEKGCRGCDLYLPWRAPVSEIVSVEENGVALSSGTDYTIAGARPGKLRRLSGESPSDWSAARILVTFKAGFDTATSLATNIDPTIEAAAIEQMKGMLFGADRDPTIRSESTQDVGSVSYSVVGGDVMGASVLLPAVRDMLAPWRNPAP